MLDIDCQEFITGDFLNSCINVIIEEYNSSDENAPSMCKVIADCKTMFEGLPNKKNEVYLKIETEPSTARSISDFFTFEVPGAKFMPAYRNRIWDGKIRLFSPANGELYLGLLSYLEGWLEDYDEPYTINEELKDEKTIDRPILDGFIRQLGLRARGKSIRPRDYQVDAVEYAIRKHRALLLSPTASGKSLIIYILVRYYEM